MASKNPFNVYTGPKALEDYYNPDLQPLLPLVELPETLNPFKEHGIRIYAKMMTMLPAHNVKALPALNMLSSSVKRNKTKTVIEYSSGSTVLSMSIIAKIFHGIDDTHAYLSNKTSESKLQLMRFFGLNITLFGGPSQPEPLDERGGIQHARRKAAGNDEIANPNQYENDANWQSHFRWTGPQILKQLPNVNVVCAGLGTSGTMTGLGTFFKMTKPSVIRVAVCTKPGDRVPGPRSYALLSPVQFPWRDAVDVIEEVSSVDSYTLSMKLSREGLICGPSSGFNLQGLYQLLERYKSAGTLNEMRNGDGLIHCAFLCCDLPYQYVSEYFTKVDGNNFHPVRNQNLAMVDLYRYDEAWELEAHDALARVFDFPYDLDFPKEPDLTIGFESLSDIATLIPSLSANTLLLDLRTAEDFRAWKLPSSINLPLETLTSDTCSPFQDPSVLEKQWLELELLLKNAVVISPTDELSLLGQHVLLVCYDGDTSRVATSILRARNIDAYSMRGGIRGMLLRWPKLQTMDSKKERAGRLPTDNTSVPSINFGEFAGCRYPITT